MLPDIPLEVLEIILQHAQPSDKAALCRTSKSLYHCSKGALYRHLDLNSRTALNACFAISGRPELQPHVNTFTLIGTEVQMSLGVIQDTLLLLPHLHTLVLSIGLYGSWILPSPDACPFQLRTFKTGFPYGNDVLAFLEGQHQLQHLSLGIVPIKRVICTPQHLLQELGAIAAPLSVVQKVVPGRPIHEVTVYTDGSERDYMLLDCLSKSAAKGGVRRLTTTREYFHLVGGKRLASIAPNLMHIALDASNINPASEDIDYLFPPWMERIISRQKHLRSFTVRFNPKVSTIPCQRIDFSDFITRAFENSSTLKYVVIIFLGLQARYTCKRIPGHDWFICDNSEVLSI